jgi:Flp pilus assembly protein TadG
MNRLKNRLAALVQHRRGEMMVEVLVKFLITTVFVLTLIEFYGIFTRYQNLEFAARRAARAIEVSGSVQGVEAAFQSLCNRNGLDGAALSITAVYCNGSGGIQLRDTFSISASFTYQMRIFTPNEGLAVTLPIPLRVNLTGMSEVYYKL